MMKVYATRLRPAVFGGVPDGVQWEWVRVPVEIAHRFPELPASRRLYGEFRTTNRELTPEEIDRFNIEIVEG